MRFPFSLFWSPEAHDNSRRVVGWICWNWGTTENDCLLKIVKWLCPCHQRKMAPKFLYSDWKSLRFAWPHCISLMINVIPKNSYCGGLTVRKNQPFDFLLKITLVTERKLSSIEWLNEKMEGTGGCAQCAWAFLKSSTITDFNGLSEHPLKGRAKDILQNKKSFLKCDKHSLPPILADLPRRSQNSCKQRGMTI